MEDQHAIGETRQVEDESMWDFIGTMKWQHVVLVVAALACFTATFFAPACTLRISSSPSTTSTTEAHDGR